MGLEWMEVDAFRMPELPTGLDVDPILAGLLHMACFMELSGENAVDFDESIKSLQAMGYYLQRLTPAQVKQISAQLKRIATYAKKNKWKPESIKFISKLLENAGIEE